MRALFVAAMTVAAFLSFMSAASAEVVTDSAVEVSLGGRGHGSGVYIGDGYVLTAAHVADEAGEGGEVEIKRKRSEDYTDAWTGTVVWIDKVQDFALVRIKAVLDDAHLPAAEVSCDKFKMQQSVTIVGWPRDLGRIQSQGYVAGAEEKRGPWAHALVVVAPVTFGNSGGPVYDNATGKVAGLAVGILNGTSLSIVIPTYRICKILPRSIKLTEAK